MIVVKLVFENGYRIEKIYNDMNDAENAVKTLKEPLISIDYIEVKEDIISRVSTNIDVMDISEELNISWKTFDYIVCNLLAKETGCYNCKYVARSYPCDICSRGKTDLYEEYWS